MQTLECYVMERFITALSVRDITLLDGQLPGWFVLRKRHNILGVISLKFDKSCLTVTLYTSVADLGDATATPSETFENYCEELEDDLTTTANEIAKRCQ